MVEPRVVLFLGSDELEKAKKLEGLQSKLFPPNLKDLNYSVVYGDEKSLTARELKEALTCVATQGAKKRLVVIKHAHKLSKINHALLVQEMPKLTDGICLVLDVPEAKDTQGLVEEMSKLGAQIVRFKSEIPLNVFDLGRSIVGHEPQTALKLLAGLMTHRERAEKILGAVFWQWEHSYSQKRLTLETYKKGLKLILEADKRLKSSSSAFARETLILEALVVKLAYLA